MKVKETKEAYERKTGEVTLSSLFRAEIDRRRGHTETLFYDILTFFVSMALSGCHIAFGAHPLGLALVAATPYRVLIVALGAALGSLFMGNGGIVYAMTAVIVVLLRVTVSGTEKRGEAPRGIFCEGRLLRCSAAVIGGFVCGIYELLLHGLTLTAVLYAAAMVAFCGIFAFLFGGLFVLPMNFHDFIFGCVRIFSRTDRERGEKIRLWDFQAALATLVACTCASLRNLDLFGISFAYLAAAAATLFAARRFGVLRGAATGFLSCIGLSATYAVSFALGGLAAGLLFPLGIGYAVFAMPAAVAAWSAYAGGLVGFLSTAPECAVVSVLMLPLLRKLPAEAAPPAAGKPDKVAADMVGTMALSYRSGAAKSEKRLETSLSSLVPVLRKLSVSDTKFDTEDERLLLTTLLSDTCRGCRIYPMCGEAGKKETLSALLAKRAAGEELTAADLFCFSGDEGEKTRFMEAYRQKRAAAEAGKFHEARSHETAEICELVAKMMNEAALQDERERTQDVTLSEKLTDVFLHHGFPDGTLRVYGDRRKYILAAGEDKDGTKITSPQLHAALAEAAGLRLSTPEYFRKDEMVLMECHTESMFGMETATATRACRPGDVSGDSVRCFESSDGVGYLVLSDGMGTGASAGKVSSFTVDYLSRMTDAGCTKNTVLYLLNQLLRSRGDECTSTVDMFALDLVSGDGEFYKSGAAPSYMKRDKSLFRIRSQTVPVGLLRTLDSEKIRVEVHAEDVIIMLSDGISSSPEDAPWLMELLDRPVPRDLQTYAEHILDVAVKNVGQKDDMTVLVARITAR